MLGSRLARVMRKANQDELQREEPNLKIVVVGPGRIGMPLARAARAAGQDVTILAREGSRSGNAARTEGFLVFTEVSSDKWSDVDLILFAVAPENPERFSSPNQLKTAFHALAAAAPSTPVASVSGRLDLQALATLFGDRALGRFFCSPAIADPDALRFFDSGSSRDALCALEVALPSPAWRPVPSDAFDRYGALLTAAALVCAPLIELRDSLGPLTEDEDHFLASTLEEAGRLLRAHGGDPAASLLSALTPGGMTASFCQRVFRRSGCLLSQPTRTLRNDT